MERLFIQMMYKSQFRKIDHYDWFCVPGSHIVFMFMVANNFLETYENLQFLQSLGFILKTLVTFFNSSHSGHNSSLCWLNSGWFSTALPQNTFNDYKLHELLSHKNTTTTTSQYAHFHTPFKTVKLKFKAEQDSYISAFIEIFSIKYYQNNQMYLNTYTGVVFFNYIIINLWIILYSNVNI